MLIKNFQADSIREAMKRVKEEFGTDAMILNSRVVEEKGRQGTTVKKRFEITAGKDLPTGDRPANISIPNPSGATLSHEDKRLISDVGLLIRRFEREINYLVNTQKEIRALLKVPAEAQSFCSFLEQNDLDRDLITRLFEGREMARMQEMLDLESLRLRLLEMSAQPQPIKLFAGGTNKVAFIGPPGSGKSSLLAKIAGHLVTKRHVKTRLVNMDDYKPSAAEEMEAYSRILNVPLWNDEDLQADHKSQDFQVILVDTGGLAINASDDLNKLADKLEIIRPDEVHLVIPAYCLWREVDRWLDFYSPLMPTQVAITFLDQTESFGLPFNLAAFKSLKLSYFSWGRGKLAHLEEADLYRISAKLFEKVEEFDVRLGK